MKSFILYALISFSFLFYSCQQNNNRAEEQYAKEVQEFRHEKDDYLRNNPASPFNQDSALQFEPLNYYPADPAFVFKSRLYEYPRKDTIIVFGTKGEARKVVRYGYIMLDYEKQSYNVNVYEGTSPQGEEYYSIWFTDKTTGGETYGVGRYIDFEINPDSNYVYTVDFNLAYNPYCAYSPKYSCAIPTKEDHLDFAVTAGEKKFH